MVYPYDPARPDDSSPQAKLRDMMDHVLADTAETSEIGRLAEWLDRELSLVPRDDKYQSGYRDALRHVLYHIKSEFGYGGEDADRKPTSSAG